MIGAISAGRRAARPAVLGAGATAAAVMLASSAAAAPAAHAHGPGERSLKTLFASVRVFGSASNRAPVKADLRGQGTGVRALCWTTGAFYKDTPVWYEISAPSSGYVSAFNLNTHFAPAVRMPHCLSPAFSEQFYTLEANLRIRSSANTTARVAGYLGGIGSRVRIDCYVKGAAVFEDPVWYHVAAPAAGYVTGRLLNTGGDPAPGVPRC